jgi:hypothetical protein
MLPFHSDRVLANARAAETEDLLDRVTVFREAMEPEAVEILEAELARRGVTPEEIHAHHRGLKHRIVRTPDGLPARCSFCPRAAVERRIGWHRLWKLVPVFQRTFYYCDEHWQSRGGGAAAGPA